MRVQGQAMHVTPGFWLSHHFEADLHRCYRFGRTSVCARCLGTYPTLLVALTAQGLMHAPVYLPMEVPVVLLLTAPATFDWVHGQWRPHAFSNAWRTLTGVALGLGLGRSLFVHFASPWPPVLLAQLGLALATVALVVLVGYLRGRTG